MKQALFALFRSTVARPQATPAKSPAMRELDGAELRRVAGGNVAPPSPYRGW